MNFLARSPTNGERVSTDSVQRGPRLGSSPRLPSATPTPAPGPSSAAHGSSARVDHRVGHRCGAGGLAWESGSTRNRRPELTTEQNRGGAERRHSGTLGRRTGRGSHRSIARESGRTPRRVGLHRRGPRGAVDGARWTLSCVAASVRPAFAYWAGATVPGTRRRSPEAMRLFSALELLQACAPVHDDVIDASSTRRGMPTVHVRFEDMHRSWPGGAPPSSASPRRSCSVTRAGVGRRHRRHGRAARPGARAGPPGVVRHPDRGARRAVRPTSSPKSSAADTIESAMRVNTFKTASHHTTRPLQLGVAAAADRPDVQAVFGEVGTELGSPSSCATTSGCSGDPAVTGKPSGDDPRSGKRTVPLAEAIGTGRLIRSGGRRAAAPIGGHRTRRRPGRRTVRGHRIGGRAAAVEATGSRR